jgi:hypothetical protein
MRRDRPPDEVANCGPDLGPNAWRETGKGAVPVRPSLVEVEVTLPILLVLLAGAISLVVALSAFIVSRAFGRSAFRAICYAAASFTAAFTLILLTLAFVESAGQHGYMHPRGGPTTMDPFVTMNSNGEAVARISDLSKTHVRVAGYVP